MFYQKVEVIYDLELLMIWNRKKNGKQYLVYGLNNEPDHQPNLTSIKNDLIKNERQLKNLQDSQYKKLKHKVKELQQEMKDLMQ